MWDFFHEMLLDTKARISSKRVVTFIAFILLCTAYIADLLFSIDMQEFIFDGMLYVVSGGLGFSALEHFAPNPFGNATKTSGSDIITNVGVGTVPVVGNVENPELYEG